MELTWAAKYAAQGNISKFARVIELDRDYFMGNATDAHSALTLWLLFCPESVINTSDFIYDVWNKKDLSLYYDEDSSTESDHLLTSLPAEELENRTQTLLEFIKNQSAEVGWGTDSSLGDWIKIRIKKVEKCFGVIDSSLVEHSDTPSAVLEWYNGTAKVVSNFRQFGGTLSIETLESNDHDTNIALLLSNSTPLTINRDLEQIIVPYVDYNQCWDSLNQWVGHNYQQLDLLTPLAHYFKLQSAVISACYMSQESSSPQTLEFFKKVVMSLDVDKSSSTTTASLQDFDSFDSIFNSDLSKDRTLFANMVQCCTILTSLTLPRVTQLCLFGTSSQQVATLEEYVNTATKVKNIENIYKEALQLKDSGVFGKIDQSSIDEYFISHALHTANFEFINQHKFAKPIQLVLDAFDRFYDSATNGNITRGAMKNAAKCLELLPEGDPTRSALLSATHELSQFSLTLTPGVPLKPVEIKQYAHDPLYIILRLLELNETAYEQCNRLTGIAIDLVEGLGHPGYSAPDTVDVRVRAMCAESALVNGDFGSAYKFCNPALSTLSNSAVAWTSCFQVGKFMSISWSDSVPPRSVLEKQLEMLSCTLKICPAESIPTVLSVWKQKDDQSLMLELGNYTAKEASAKPQPQPQPHPQVQVEPQPQQQDQESQQDARRRDQISNLLVSGLGWAIGANQR